MVGLKFETKKKTRQQNPHQLDLGKESLKLISTACDRIPKCESSICEKST